MRNLNIHRLRSGLNCLCNVLNQEYNINSGGCCYVSYIIAKHLEKLNVRYSLVIYDDLKRDQSVMEFEVLNKQHVRASHSVTGSSTCIHYGIIIEGAGLVNCKDFEDSEYRFVVDEVEAKQIHWIYKQGQWNQEYERKHNKSIKKAFKEFFRSYK